MIEISGTCYLPSFSRSHSNSSGNLITHSVPDERCYDLVTTLVVCEDVAICLP
jgi:hypothetical protein